MIGIRRSMSSSALSVLLLAGCGGGNGPPAEADLVEGEDVRLEGRVTDIDRTPMFVDGDGRIYLDSEAHGAVVVRVPARERPCRAEGLDALSSLGPGDRMRATGRVTGPGEVTVCVAERHALVKLD